MAVLSEPAGRGVHEDGPSRRGAKFTGEALAFGRAHRDHCWEAETLRLNGELLLKKDEPDATEAHRCFERAIEISRSQCAKFWELRATMSLARLLAKQGRRDEGRTMLADIYNWFTEGFDAADLKDAKALLDQLSN
jgi:predicted ATPase